ncbi:MAG: peptidoglycan DD-metalloendopeptidase family protein [Paludibacter sp.]|nr:peptidoglycan DD-metalloendopeptidase family protein [Bacteroidales bacterium]MCM1069673.1 peptidoglycan DD-metalloendopeptidase family protein [Prevotella sp.]MCM1354319.1 peptidoglycan DD-metalloendopeptidase family protein [Bacteroides sp.]MCM1443142.1 peptidoglycan DD-metalloendopeptidase family protein [Muribaculum sp.]MCM1482377.1 peptidoglycan DD-metalloendopeptidase family protein [Paludibacter sp.]
MKHYFCHILLLLLLSTSVVGQSVKELEKQRKQTLQQLENTGKMLKETKRNETATINKLNLLNRDIKTRKQLIANLGSEITALDEEMRQLCQQKDQLQAELEALKADYAELIRQTHYADIQKSPLLFVLAADNFNQMYQRIRYMQEFAAYRKTQVHLIEDKQTEIDNRNQLLQQNKQNKQDVLQVRKREQENLARDERKQQSMLSELKKKEKNLLAQQKKQQKKADELNRKIDRMIQKEVKQTASTLTKEQQLIAGGFEKNKGRLPWPTEKGFISGQFGVQAHPTLAHVTVNNRGIYIQTTAGATARAVYEGEVSAVFVSDGQNVVIIKHGNYRTVYSNLTALYVKNGDKVAAKQKIGKIYTDPDNDNKTELFFQIRKNTDVINPSLWLTK